MTDEIISGLRAALVEAGREIGAHMVATASTAAAIRALKRSKRRAVRGRELAEEQRADAARELAGAEETVARLCRKIEEMERGHAKALADAERTGRAELNTERIKLDALRQRLEKAEASAADAAASVQAASGAADAYRTQRDTAYAGHDKTRGLLYAAKKRIAELEAACSGK
jgi:chromosome segregation ATPase